MTFSRSRSLCCALATLCFALQAHAQPVPPQPDTKAQDAKTVLTEGLRRSSYGEFIAHANARRRSAPAKTIAEIRAYLAEQEQALTASQIAGFYALISAIHSSELRDNTAALAALEEGLGELTNDPARFTLVTEKARVFSLAGKRDEAEKLLQQEWPGIRAQGLAPRILPTYVALLSRNNKAPQALQLTRQTTVENFESTRDGQNLITALIDLLVAAGQTEEALSWSKLNLMLCAYNERSLQMALRLAARAGAAKGANAPTQSTLVAALQDPNKPNPLRDVKLPELDAAALRARLTQTRRPDERVALLIGLQDWQDAMLTARRWMLERPQVSQSVLQICRVFKARDLNLSRANAFLEYYNGDKTKNPVAEFLAETEKQ